MGVSSEKKGPTEQMQPVCFSFQHYWSNQFAFLNVFISFSFQAMVSEIAPSVYLRLCYLNTIVSESVPSMGGY